MAQAAQIASTFGVGVTNVLKNRIFQVVAVIYYLGRRSATKKIEEDIVKLPQDTDPVLPGSNVSQNQMSQLVDECHSRFYTVAGIPGMGYLKTQTIKKMLGLNNTELSILNNTYNQRYVPLGNKNLYTEIKNDFFTSEEPWRSRILTRISALPRK